MVHISYAKELSEFATNVELVNQYLLRYDDEGWECDLAMVFDAINSCIGIAEMLEMNCTTDYYENVRATFMDRHHPDDVFPEYSQPEVQGVDGEGSTYDIEPLERPGY